MITDNMEFVLEGRYVRLEPMAYDHLDELVDIGLEPSLWEFTPGQVSTPNDMRRYVEAALHDREAGKALPMVTRMRESHEIVGSTRFANIEEAHRKAEIGWTWIVKDWQRSVVNTEAKFVMLRHAFETWGLIRVEFKTDATNTRSRGAISRLGATEEGILRQHIITDSGRYRDTVYFSILDKEWPAVRSNLIGKLERYNG